MSFPPSFGSQVAAIMDVLATAAVAEITKLVEDGSVVLRMEICRRDGEIQELRRSLELMAAELCKAQEACTARAQEALLEHAGPGRLGPQEEKQDDKERTAMYLEPKATDPLSEHPGGTNKSVNIQLVVKLEPTDQAVATETADGTATADISFEPAEPVESVWSAPACGMFEESSASTKQHVQILSSRAEQYSAPSNTDVPFIPLQTTAEETREGGLSLPIKVEVESPSACMGSVTAQSIQNEQFRDLSHPSFSQDQSLQSALQEAGPSLVLHHAPRSAAGTPGSHTQDHFNRNNARAKRLMNVWRGNQKLFICSVCNKGFFRLSQLDEHKAVHQAVKPFRCLECGKSFTQNTRLKTHQRVHTGERPYSCKICGKMFSRQDNCLRHERFHSGLKPYSCRQCGKSFTVQGNLKIHQEIHLQGR